MMPQESNWCCEKSTGGSNKNGALERFYLSNRNPVDSLQMIMVERQWNKHTNTHVFKGEFYKVNNLSQSFFTSPHDCVFKFEALFSREENARFNTFLSDFLGDIDKDRLKLNESGMIEVLRQFFRRSFLNPQNFSSFPKIFLQSPEAAPGNHGLDYAIR